MTFVITRLTFLEAARRRIALAGFVLGLGFLVLFSPGFYFLCANAPIFNGSLPAQNLLRAQAVNFLSLSRACTPSTFWPSP
jgi:hypothetical protein